MCSPWPRSATSEIVHRIAGDKPGARRMPLQAVFAGIGAGFHGVFRSDEALRIDAGRERPVRRLTGYRSRVPTGNRGDFGHDTTLQDYLEYIARLPCIPVVIEVSAPSSCAAKPYRRAGGVSD